MTIHSELLSAISQLDDAVKYLLHKPWPKAREGRKALLAALHHYPTPTHLKALIGVGACKHENAEPMERHNLFACPDCRRVVDGHLINQDTP